MKEYTELKNKITGIIEQSNTDKPACKNCKKCCDGMCYYNSVNERNGGAYRFSNGKMTTPDYFCENFDVRYKISEETRNTLYTFLNEIERVNEGAMNLDLFISGRINEDDFNEMMK